MKFFAIIIVLVVAMCACESIFAQSTTKKVVIRTYYMDASQRLLIDDKHESDEFIYADLGEVQYLDQTNPLADTLSTYFFKVPTVQCSGITKKGLQCKNRTTGVYCRLHNKATACSR